jgi:hypothetical protein
MNNVIEYIKEYGNISFEKIPFNEVDGAIMAMLSYIDFRGIVSSSKEYITLKDALNHFVNKRDLEEFYSRGKFQKEIIEMCHLLIKKKRFRDLLLFGFIYNVDLEEQFGVLSIKLPTKEIVISFEGTDHNLVGWEEDAKMSYLFPIKAETSAINYVNKMVGIFGKDIYLVGHSKGGHLALVAGMYIRRYKQHRIKNIISYDGPGLRNKQISSKEYSRIESKYIHIVPNYSVVGMMLRSNDHIVIKSARKDFLAHSIMTWLIDKDKFIREPLSDISTSLEQSMLIWLNKTSQEDREKLVKELFSYLKESGLDNTQNIKSLKNIINLIKNKNKVSKESMELLNNFIKFNILYYLDNR